ncbi:Protein AE7-like 1 [Mucuna pruriens]|uniref:Protein AE7-like 1 n=1 Tax=Mucuna pruriens TaxID=157652 RepID=A0A371H8G9_MUCPR|nr:Protein AE7-like 1 [Mucuna pruriens]
MRTLWFTPRKKESLAPKILTPLILSIFMISFLYSSFSLFPLFALSLPTNCTFVILDFALTNFVRDIRDPEHPYSLEQLSVLSEESITVDDKLGRILITFTPTVQHCSMATVIGLCLRVKLKHYFPPHYKVDIKVSPGSHADEESVNKQLNDKERVAAALENPNLSQLVDECLYSNEL